MKKAILIVLSLFSIVLHAQDWQWINSGGSSYSTVQINEIVT